MLVEEDAENIELKLWKILSAVPALVDPCFSGHRLRLMRHQQPYFSPILPRSNAFQWSCSLWTSIRSSLGRKGPVCIFRTVPASQASIRHLTWTDLHVSRTFVFTFIHKQTL